MPFEPLLDDLKVMNSLIHPDTVATIMSETSLSRKVCIDIVRNLFHYRYIKPVNNENKTITSFDVDNIDKVKFILTGKGISYWEENSFRLKQL